MLFEKTLLNKQIAKVLSGAVLMGAISAPALAEQANTVSEGELIIAPKAGLSDEQFAAILEKQGAKLEKKEDKQSKKLKQKLRANLVKVPKGQQDKILKALAANPHIEYAEVNRLVSIEAVTMNDPKQSWHLNKINMPEAWSKSKGKGVVVAVLDTGVNKSHEDLKANLLPGYNIVSKNTDTTDTNGHGTKVAGVVAAVSNNSKGVASIAAEAKVLPVKISNRSDGVASLFDIARALSWAADNGADIANVSYQITDSATVSGAAKSFYEKGGLVVAAAGNSGKSMSCTDNKYIVTVSASTSSDGIASFSNYGPCIDVAAPGQGLQTTTKNGSYGSASGTSFAAPSTAAVLAVLKAANPTMKNSELESLLENNADNSMFSGSFSNKYGHGRIDAGAALRDSVYVPEPEPELDQTAPEVNITSPKQDTEVKGQFSVNVNATDNEAVKKVELYFAGQRIGADFSSPYSFSVNSSTVADGEHALTAVATDTAGNVTETSNHYVMVKNAEIEVTPDPEPEVPVDGNGPKLTLLSPDVSVTQSQELNVMVDAVDSDGVEKVEIYFRGRLVKTLTAAPYNHSINISKLGSGYKTLQVIAYDTKGNSTATDVLNVMVDNTQPEPEVPTNPEPTDPEPTDPEPEVPTDPEPEVPGVDTEAPYVQIVTPQAGSTNGGELNIEVDAQDNVAVTKVELYFRGRLVKTKEAGPYEFTINISRLSEGEKTLRAVAYDAAGNVADTGEHTIYVDNSIEGTEPGTPTEPEPEPQPEPEPEPEVPSVPDNGVNPTVEILAPYADSTHSGELFIDVMAEDNDGIEKVEIYFRGRLVKTKTEYPYTHTINISKLSDGAKSLKAIAYDKNGNQAETAEMTIYTEQ
ncbi:Ig-like domain-containing protein [Thalassotalea mangrovi]|uniref:Uncharacterized protein n=1 Tax=Thalassotalea mangrovi TaxID=2572245 RepID=A0A4U1B2T2_9GAMM|nr:Ig-like domain-containing protein [Thalassotalea mangrovi]TKB43964.1 hypothetical protein E8M12_13385 [Thalassotalea mangrovi]